MANVKDMFYHGQIQQIKRVLDKMTDVQLERGLSAFENGESNWSHCFFARALDMDNNWRHGQISGRRLGPEQWIMRELNIPSPVPIRIVYNIFGGAGKTLGWSRKQLGEFCMDVRDGRRPAEVMELLKSLDVDWEKTESTPIEMSCVK